MQFVLHPGPPAKEEFYSNKRKFDDAAINTDFFILEGCRLQEMEGTSFKIRNLDWRIFLFG
jgi:hypothetical protein